MNKAKDIQAVIVGALAAFYAWLDILAIPLLVLVLMGIVDYVTGIAAAKYRKQEVNSRIGLWGIVKKVFMLLVVSVGCAMDVLIFYVGGHVGLSSDITFVIGSLVAVWLAVNEIISILENLVDMEVHLPPWLMKLTKNLHSKINKQAEEHQQLIPKKGDNDASSNTKS